jgi:hypothetical protein
VNFLPVAFVSSARRQARVQMSKGTQCDGPLHSDHAPAKLFMTTIVSTEFFSKAFM